MEIRYRHPSIPEEERREQLRAIKKLRIRLLTTDKQEERAG